MSIVVIKKAELPFDLTTGKSWRASPQGGETMVGSCPANVPGTRDDGVTHEDLMKLVELLAAGGG